ncbi:MAG: mannose-6-phosphate isomerase, class I [Thermodesulfobacteriota bacterium]
MRRILFLENPIQPYAWGSRTALAELLGGPVPSPGPQAELWMGAHPKAPSEVILPDGSRRKLNELIAGDPVTFLGPETAARFSQQLPYLFKVLAVEQPLSIQAHPNRVQARLGFERENREEIPLDSPHRNYKDDHHKPECICALTPFWVLCGFRPIPEILDLFVPVAAAEINASLGRLEQQPGESGLREFCRGLLSMTPGERRPAIAGAVEKAGKLASGNPAYEWMLKLHEKYPDDMGVFAPFLLNLTCLQPGQALFLPAGRLHAYLRGTAMEIMANSDNVLRGGLTPKHIDVPELMKTLHFGEHPLELLLPERVSETEKIYPTPSVEFSLSVITVREGLPYLSGAGGSAEILLCIEGAAEIREDDRKPPLGMSKGAAVFVPAVVSTYSIRGRAVLYRASVPPP